MKPPPHPDFRSHDFLRQHVLATMAFYDGRCVDPRGGFFQFFKDDGTVYDRDTRHLVSSTRFVVTHAWMARHFPQHPRAAAWREGIAHGLAYLTQAHRQPSGGFAWVLRQHEAGRAEVVDGTLHAYGHAFVLLAAAEALRSGHVEARALLDETFALMEARFWEPAHGLYADEATPTWQLSPYRGQNANMHACEAMLAAFEATGEARFLARADTLADRVTRHLASMAGGLVWEHYRLDAASGWTPDWDYNRHDRSNLFRPWGFQTGHLTEWAKLLLQLERLTPGLDDDNWRVHRARELFHAGTRHGWDRHHRGGLIYGFAPDEAHPGQFVPCDEDKYHWVQAESLAAAAALAARTGEGGYWDWYDRLWAYAWDHVVDHHHGAWYRILGPDGSKLTNDKSPAGKVDYHNIGACLEALAALSRAGL